MLLIKRGCSSALAGGGMVSHLEARAAMRALSRRGARRALVGAGTHPMEKRCEASPNVKLEHQYGAFNYHPLPVVLESGKGVFVYDEDGKQYFDFLSAYSAVNQGHCHPKLIKALTDQASKLTLTSRAFHNVELGKFCEKLCVTFGYERALPMNTGVEAGETATKLCRRWAIEAKGVPNDDVMMLFARGNFWGRTIAAISTSTDPSAFGKFGPLAPGFDLCNYNDLADLEDKLKKHGNNLAAFFVEPIQGEAGVVVPDDDYLAKAKALCEQYNVLLVCDEVQTGLGRCGELLASTHFGVRPDMVVLGKALSGGVLPVSAVLASSEVMCRIKPGEHGSTYGGNPVACVVASAALDVLIDEKMVENSKRLGARLRGLLEPLITNPGSCISAVRGVGLMNAIVVDHPHPNAAWELCLKFAERGLLAKQTHNNIVRLAPPLCITETQLDEAAAIIIDAAADL